LEVLAVQDFERAHVGLGSKARIAAAHISQPLYPNQQTYRNERPATGAATTLSEARSLRMPTPAEWRVPIQRASKGRLFDQQYQDRFDKDYGAASLLYWAHDLMS
jgi:hypothetical protein